jgi:hypothetical protein
MVDSCRSRSAVDDDERAISAGRDSADFREPIERARVLALVEGLEKGADS